MSSYSQTTLQHPFKTKIMKKILFLGLIATLFAFNADAQTARGERFKRGEFKKEVKDGKFKDGKFKRGDRSKMSKKDREYMAEKRKAMRDGKITPRERQKLAKMRKQGRHDKFRSKYNARKKVI